MDFTYKVIKDHNSNQDAQGGACYYQILFLYLPYLYYMVENLRFKIWNKKIWFGIMVLEVWN
jgi:hypothetical protein